MSSSVLYGAKAGGSCNVNSSAGGSSAGSSAMYQYSQGTPRGGNSPALAVDVDKVSLTARLILDEENAYVSSNANVNGNGNVKAADNQVSSFSSQSLGNKNLKGEKYQLYVTSNAKGDKDKDKDKDKEHVIKDTLRESRKRWIFPYLVKLLSGILDATPSLYQWNKPKPKNERATATNANTATATAINTATSSASTQPIANANANVLSVSDSMSTKISPDEDPQYARAKDQSRDSHAVQLMLQTIARDTVEPLMAVKAFYPEEKKYVNT